ncbi:MAG TPA: tryptophan--tRNA ligase [Candidatus Angelobacter sp.]|nr:tryptophan--tRNA ligase [Candidatus Angelobacter sp.]
MTDLGNSRPRCLSGMRPTGKLHLGNYVGALKNWVDLQHTHDCFFFIADWHALTTDYDDTSRLAGNTVEVMLDYLAVGLDPGKCTMFVQSHVKQHAELHLLFSMMTPLGWLERVPTYKEQQVNMPDKDLHMYGFLGYPLLMAADILIYRANFVPVGEDQDVHVELTREVARRFNSVFCKDRDTIKDPVLIEPQTLLTPSPRLLGMDKRKMSKSYGNSILISEEAPQLEQKIKNSVTDRPKLTDRGSPDRCPVGNLHQIFSSKDQLAYITEGCTQATIGCVECKALATTSVNAHLAPIRDRRYELAQHPERVKEVIQQGAKKAERVAEETMVAVREAVGLLGSASLPKPTLVEIGADLLLVPITKTNEPKEIWDIRVKQSGWLDKINRLHPLRFDRPATFITSRGRKVGVHTASENNGTWEFLMRDRPLNVLVLLAEDKDRYLHDYVLPPKILQYYWKDFERKGEQVVVRVARTEDGVSLSVAGKELPIQEYERNYAALE